MPNANQAIMNNPSISSFRSRRKGEICAIEILPLQYWPTYGFMGL